MTTMPAGAPAVTNPPDASYPGHLRAQLAEVLDPQARAWLAAALESASRQPQAPADAGAVPRWELHFAEAGRRLRATEAVTDAARVLLLHHARATTPVLNRLYRHGTAAERRAVLMALPHLAELDPGQILPLVHDALRTHDTRLLAAAVGTYAAEHLDPHSWRHAVLKCLFTGVPVSALAQLPRRASGDRELARMLTDFAAERTAAGRPLPAGLPHVLALTDPSEDH
ncbi:EboA domain-containing protein [Streptomyces sp. NPDC006879]|uniref:EboA domain-containing protein n=1 Tax=Streptomyces sp. NPDC006879 TaxID=3364767 RepID=UPI0036CA2F30